MSAQVTVLPECDSSTIRIQDDQEGVWCISHNTPHSYSAKMTFTDLSNPLLGKLSRRRLELEHERDEQYAEHDEEVCMRGSKSIVHNSSQEESDNERSSDECQSTWWCVASGFLLCFWIWSQAVVPPCPFIILYVASTSVALLAFG
jgi:hypothetical protein